MSEKLLLIDGHSMLYKAFYALPPLTNSKGVYTNAIYGFMNILFKTIDTENPDYIGVAFDVSSKTFRTDMFEEYKGTRKKMPDELRDQIPLIQDLLGKMNIEIFQLEGYEADDILGTISKIGEEEGLEVGILSGDRDLFQLSSEKVKIIMNKTVKGKAITENYYKKEVMEKYQVTPIEFIDVKGLMGDPSDNIPGVPSIGEKTAIKLIKEFKTIENTIANAEKIKGKNTREKLIEFKEQALLSKKLATIVRDVPLKVSINDLKLHDIYNENAYKEFVELELKTHYKRFESSTDELVNDRANKYILVDNPFMVDDITNDLNDHGIYFKIFNEDNDFYISLCIKNKVYIFLRDESFTKEDILDTLKPIFESKNSKITSFSKEAYVFAYKNGIAINNIEFDTALAAYILDPLNENYEFNNLSMEYLGETYSSLSDILGKGKNKLEFNNLPLKDKCKYINNEILVTRDLHRVLKEKLIESDQIKIYYDIELPVSKVLADMEYSGINVSKEILKSYGIEIEKSINTLHDEIIDLAGEDFNINSPKQLGTILFEKLNLSGGKKNKTGYSTAADVLEKIKYEHIIVEKILDYRTLTKLKSTYVDGLISEIENDGKIHSKFKQTITATGRISSTEPNLQNIPVKQELGRKLRKAFTAKEGYVFLSGDYSQIELRVLAHMSNDSEMINAFKNDIDIHALTASEVYKVDIDKVQSFQRSNAKAVNFGIVYGISSFSLSQDLSITKKEADRYIAGYFRKYPDIKEYLDNTVEDAKNTGYASTIFNRKRKVDELHSKNFNIRNFGSRIAMNMPIQGTAADIIKIAMINTFKELEKQGLKSKIILQVHDELILEVEESELDIVKRILKEKMEEATNLRVPLDVSFSVGNNWYDLK